MQHLSTYSFLPLPPHQHLATTHLFTVCRLFPFPGCPIGGIIQYIAFTDWLLSLSSMHLLHAFSETDSLFLWIASLNGCTTISDQHSFIEGHLGYFQNPYSEPVPLAQDLHNSFSVLPTPEMRQKSRCSLELDACPPQHGRLGGGGLGIYLSLLQRLEGAGVEYFLSPHELGFNKTHFGWAVVKQFPLKVGLVKEWILWQFFKMVPFPLPCWKPEGIFLWFQWQSGRGPGGKIHKTLEAS